LKAAAILKKAFYSTWFLAFIPAVILFFLLETPGKKYDLRITEAGKGTARKFYYDLNSDGITEVISSGKGIPLYNILVQDNDMRVYDQWNFPDNIDLNLSDFFFGNYDHDIFSEIFIFTHKEDSLFINMNEFLQPDGTRLERIYITKLGYVNGDITSMVFPAGFYDLDMDGNDELYFTIQTGFDLEPRRAYSFNFKTRHLSTSEFTGMICLYPQLKDVDGDRKPEMFGTMNASGNYKTKPPFSDRSAWLMIFDENLRFEFPPVEFPGFPNQMHAGLLFSDTFRGFILSYYSTAVDTALFKSRVMLYSLQGDFLKGRLYEEFGLTTVCPITMLNNNRIYLLGNYLIEINQDLEIINKKESPFNSYFSIYNVDVNLDDDEEIILYSSDEEKMVVLNTSLDIIAEAPIKSEAPYLRFSHPLSKEIRHRVFMTTSSTGYFLELIKQDYYFLGYLIYPGIYFLIFFFIVVIRRINTLQIVRRENLKQRLITLQLQGIKSQLDPHFTFNTLNSVASLIYLEEREAAYDYLNKFTQLLRNMLNDADRIYRRIGEEVKFVTTYLELEKLRFGDKFNFEIKIGEGVTMTEEVPKLVLQTFAENAVKHGIMPNPDGGRVKISIERQNDYLRLIIEDNGIGRERSAGQSTSTGKGLKLTGEFYSILNEINKNPISHNIKDLYSESGEPAGTLVEVWVPVG